MNIPKAETFRFWQMGGYTYATRDGGAGQIAFRGVSVMELTEHMQRSSDEIARHKRNLLVLHAIVQEMDASAVTYQSIHKAVCDVAAMHPASSL